MFGLLSAQQKKSASEFGRHCCAEYLLLALEELSLKDKEVHRKVREALQNVRLQKQTILASLMKCTPREREKWFKTLTAGLFDVPIHETEAMCDAAVKVCFGRSSLREFGEQDYKATMQRYFERKLRLRAVASFDALAAGEKTVSVQHQPEPPVGFSVNCPNCSANYVLDESHFGVELECGACLSKFSIARHGEDIQAVLVGGQRGHVSGGEILETAPSNGSFLQQIVLKKHSTSLPTEKEAVLVLAKIIQAQLDSSDPSGRVLKPIRDNVYLHVRKMFSDDWSTFNVECDCSIGRYQSESTQELMDAVFEQWPDFKVWHEVVTLAVNGADTEYFLAVVYDPSASSDKEGPGNS